MVRLIPWVGAGALAIGALAWNARGAEADAEAVSAEPFAGTWAQLRVQTAIAVVPVLGRTVVTNTSVLRLRLTASGRNLTMSTELCGIEQDTGIPLVDVEFPEALVRGAGRFDAQASLRSEGGALQFFQARQWVVFGARLADQDGDSLPTAATDERVYDQDGDGNPGMTMRIRGLLDVDLYMVQRGWTSLRGTMTSEDRIDGRVSWGEDHTVLGSSSSLLTDVPASRPDSDPQASYFRMTRIATDVDCAAILAQRDTLFAR
jgi:hypothetical protein